MSPQSQQTVYTVVDCLALILPMFVVGYALAGTFVGAARVTGDRLWCGLYTASIVWLALRLAGVVA